MGRTGREFDPVADRQPGHRERLLQILRPIIDPGQNVTMEIDQETSLPLDAE
jgi:hypothetical protein